MKATTPVLLLSLAANLALGGLLLWRAAPAAPPPLTTSPAAAAKPAAPVVTISPGTETWPQLSAASDHEFAARLKAEGFPPNMLYALVSLRLRERHAEEYRKFRPSADYAYWRDNPTINDVPPEDRAARRALDRRVAEEMKQLLGPDANPASIYERANRERLYGNLPAEKADEVAAITRDYGEIATLVRERTKGLVLQQDRDQLAAIEQEKRADLARVLTPAELLEFDLRASPSAATVRMRLRNFDDITEEEYRALTAVQLAFDTTYGGTNLSAAQEERRKLAETELAAEIKTLLPPERFAEYEIKTDPTYNRILAMISQANASADPGAVVGAQRDFAARFNALRSNTGLSPAVRDAQLDALSAEANDRMAAALGPDAFRMYKASGGPINALLNRRKP